MYENHYYNNWGSKCFGNFHRKTKERKEVRKKRRKRQTNKTELYLIYLSVAIQRHRQAIESKVLHRIHIHTLLPSLSIPCIRNFLFYTHQRTLTPVPGSLGTRKRMCAGSQHNNYQVWEASRSLVRMSQHNDCGEKA